MVISCFFRKRSYIEVFFGFEFCSYLIGSFWRRFLYFGVERDDLVGIDEFGIVISLFFMFRSRGVSKSVRKVKEFFKGFGWMLSGWIYI